MEEKNKNLAADLPLEKQGLIYGIDVASCKGCSGMFKVVSNTSLCDECVTNAIRLIKEDRDRNNSRLGR